MSPTSATTGTSRAPRPLGEDTVVPRTTAELHGSRVSYVDVGEGSPLVLLHGITCSAASWNPVVEDLARRHRVIVPDLPGHGGASKTRGDYSIAGFALYVRDLLYALEVEHATVVGHSLGGGVAMQLLYAHPELVGRLVLVASGGLGRAVGLPLRMATLPGAELVLPVLCNRRLVGAAHALARMAKPWAPSEVQQLAYSYATLAHPAARRAFLATIRGAVDWQGQRIDATARLHLAEEVPSLMLWGNEDLVIPIHHGRRAAEQTGATRFVEFDGVGHFPFVEDPNRFLAVVDDFLATTEAADLGPADLAAELRQQLRGETPRPTDVAVA